MPRYSPLNYKFGHGCPLKPGVGREKRSICDSPVSASGTFLFRWFGRLAVAYRKPESGLRWNDGRKLNHPIGNATTGNPGLRRCLPVRYHRKRPAQITRQDTLSTLCCPAPSVISQSTRPHAPAVVMRRAVTSPANPVHSRKQKCPAKSVGRWKEVK